ncbi:TetR/AcrR family transcriptional regulator [Roseobacter sp. YSTF-M11]|uniref:TetR/AcrR family transcriptional regulator n=1 Tax=Roseobacter insulae TaxID=2859783 RepID=A0A9X1FXZ3_9RHOB|nr:TetR/AcrR family transcriptional regulator [Roseobacter insulae]MBW4709683.1 TetR/AcrR family transcriptional regulator [Roseobacter insulae]
MSKRQLPTRDRIVKAALTLLSSKGNSAVRLSDVARQAGVSRQAIYLHFSSRADLFIAATQALDAELDLAAMLHASRTAASGRDRLTAFVSAWCSYVPQIYCVARPLMDMAPRDAEAHAAWSKRMNDLREGCEAAITALRDDDDLPRNMDPETATDTLWSLLTVPNWENLVVTRGWPQAKYEQEMVKTAQSLFVAPR